MRVPERPHQYRSFKAEDDACPPRKQYRCRYCGAELPAWIPVFNEPNGAMLLHHLSQDHPDQIKAYLDQMRGSEDIGEVAAQAYEVVDD
jgi:hypothetical protein